MQVIYIELEGDGRGTFTDKDITVTIIIYNMVGLAVAMVISTIYEYSCIDFHNAGIFISPGPP